MKSILANLDRFKSLVYFEVKDDSRLLFWHDVWCGDRPLKTQFPSLFRMTHLKNAMVDEVVSWNVDICHWNLTFVRSLNDWEEDSVWGLLALLAVSRSCPNDEIVWRLNS